MTDTTQLTIGVDAICTDGSCGELSRVVVDPIAGLVTHVVVEPKYRSGLGKLVPLKLVDAGADEIRLRCSLAEFDELDAAEETTFLPGNNGGYGGYPAGQMVVLPHLRLSDSFPIPGGAFDPGTAFQPVVSDTVPMGEITVRRDEPVHATDGEIGRVQGLIIDPGDHHVTHVLLQEGHLWGRKDVAIPMSAITGVANGIRLNITKRQVGDLPTVNVGPPDA